MSTNLIEKEVVKMEFDNSDFEKKTKESMSTLEKLKESLNFDKAKSTLSTFAKQANELDFSGLMDSVDTVAKRFSNLGIVGMTVVSRLTNSLIDGVARISNSISGMIVSGGISRAMNIEKAKFQLEGLGVTWDKIKDDIDYGVKDTAYGLDAAANVAAQLVTSGVELGENMRTALRGISGVASMTGSTYEEIGMIYTQVAGQGRLMGDQLSRLSYRGLNAAAELGRALGKTESEIREMASKGQIDFQTFANAMDKAFGEHAKDANRTLNGTLDNIRSAWARIGAEFVQPIIRNEGELVDLLNAYRQKINDIKAAIIPVAELTTRLLNAAIASFARAVEGIDIKDKVANIGEKITDLIFAFERLFARISFVGKKIKEVYRDIFPKKESNGISESFSKITKAIGRFNFSNDTIKKLQSVFKGLFSIVKVGATVFKNLLVVVKPIFNYIIKEAGKMLDIAATIGDIVSKIALGTIKAEDFELTFEKLTENIQGSLDKIRNGFKSLLDVFLDDEKGAKDAIDAIVDMAAGSVEAILSIVESITGLDFTEIKNGLLDFSKQVKYYFKSLYDVYTEAGGGIKGFASVIFEVIKDLGRKIADFIEETTGIDLSTLKLKIEKLFKDVETKFNSFKEKLKPLDFVSEKFKNIKSRVDELANSFHGLASSAMTGLSKVLENPFASTVSIKGVSSLFDILKNITTPQQNNSPGLLGSLLPANLDSITNSLKGFLDVTKDANRLLAIAAGITAIGYSLKIFASGVSLLSETKDFTKTIGATTEMLLAIGGIVGGMVWILNTLKGSSVNKKSVDNIFKTVDSIRSSVKITSVSIAATAVLVLAIAKSVKIMIDALSELTTLDGNPLNHISAVFEIIGALGLLMGSIYVLSSKIPKTGVQWKMFITYAVTMAVIAEAVNIMANAFATINNSIDIENWENILISFFGIVGLLGMLAVAINQIKIVNSKSLLISATGMLLMAESVGILVEACGKLKDIDGEEALMGLLSTLTILYMVMAGASQIAGKAIGLKTSVAILAIATAMAILVHQINVLANTPFDDVVKGFTALIAILGTFTLFASFFVNELKGISSAGWAMVEFAASLWIITKAINQLKDLNPDQVLQGFGTLMGSLITMALILAGLGKAEITKVGLQLLEIGAAMYIIAKAIGYLGAMDIFEILKGAGSLIIFLELLCVSVTKFSMATSGATALLIVSAALGVLAVAIGILAPLGSAIVIVGATLIGFIAILGAVAVAANFNAHFLMTGAIIIAAALGIIGLGLAVIVVDIAVFAASMALIATSAAAAADGLKLFVETLINLAVESAKNIQTMSSLTTVVTKAAMAMVVAGVGLIGLGAGLVVFGAGALVAGAGALVLAAGIGALAAALEGLIVVLQSAGLDTIVEQLGMQTGMQYAQSTAKGINSGNAVVSNAVKNLIKDALIGPMDYSMGINSPSTVMAERGMYIDMGLAEGMLNNQDIVKQASEQLGKTTSTSLTTSLTQGTQEGSKTLTDAVKVFSDISSTGSVAAGQQVGAGFMKGLSAMAPKVKAYAANLAKSAMVSMKQYLKIKSPSRLAMEIGEYTGEGFAIGMQNTETNVEDSAQDLGKTASNSLTTALSAAYNNLTSGIEDPTIKPVLDLSEIQNGASNIDSMLSRDFASNISANYRSDRDYADEQTQANASLMSGLNDRLVSALMATGGSDLPINLNVQLVGDAAGVFRLVQTENQRMTNMYGASPLMRG